MDEATTCQREDPLGQLLAGPIFVVGHIRSGTTWVFDILEAHPEVAGIFESLIFTPRGLAPLLAESHWAREQYERMYGRMAGLGQLLERSELIADVQSLADRWLGKALEPHHRYLVEKTPAGPVAVEALAVLYPDAQVVHVVRDGRDVAVSALAAQRSWQRADELGAVPPTRPQHVWSIGLNWAEQVAGLRAQGLNGSLPFHEVRYEDLHSNPLRVARELFAFCGIRCEESLLEQILMESHFSRHADVGEERFRRSARVGDWRGWPRWQRLLFSAAAGEVLEQLGYSAARGRQASSVRRILIAWEKAKQFL